MSARFIAGKLKWDISGVFEDIEAVKAKLQEDIQECPKQHQKKTQKLIRWSAQITEILEKLTAIETVLLPEIERTFRYQFQSADLVKVLFFQSSIQKLFSDVENYFVQSRVRSFADFETLLHLPDAAQVLALLGDAALDLAVAQLFWESKIARVGNITKQRSNLVSNENLARACDALHLYELRIHDVRNKPLKRFEKILKSKGTLIEGIYGIIYAERGIDAVFDALVAIK